MRRRRRKATYMEKRDWSYDKSRHVSPLNRVFLGSERAAAAAGIEFRCDLSLRSGRYRWKCSYQYRLSEPDCGPIRLIDDFRCPCPASPPLGAQLINVWVTVVFPYWYLDWWWRFRNKPYWPAEEWYVSNCLAEVFMCNGYNVGESGGYPWCANVYIWPIHADYPVCMCGAWRGKINIPTIKNSLL